MRILILTQRVPYPPNRGDKIPNYHYIRHLSQKHDVSVACLADGESDMANVAGLAEFVQSVEAVPLSANRGRIRALASLAAGSRPLTVAYFDEPELRRRILRQYNESRFDLALVCSSGMAQFVESFHDVPRIIQFTDLDSQKWRLYQTISRVPMRWVYQIESERLLSYERRLAQSFDYSLFCSARELADFRRLIGELPAACIRNGVDLNYFRPTQGKRIQNNIVFTGVMDYLPNIEGAVWFAREILPRIQAEYPDATFTICGSSPAKKVRDLERQPGVAVTGAVPDVRPYLSRASIGVVPLRTARGIQNKLIEAMAMGLPTVATSAAHAGMEAVPARELLVADDPTSFAAAVLQLLRDVRMRTEMGLAARAAMEANYHWEKSLAQLDEVIDLVRDNRSRPATPGRFESSGDSDASVDPGDSCEVSPPIVN